MNELSNDCGTYNQLRTQASKFPRLVATVDLIEQQPFSFFSPWKAIPQRQCPVAEAPHILEHNVVETRFERSSQLWNLLKCKHTADYVLLKAEDSLSDLAFERGWRIIHNGLYEHETKRYQQMAYVLDYSDFVDMFLQDNTSEDTIFNNVIVPYYADNENHQPDADEEDFDEFYSIEEQEQDNQEEF